jgi:hypothetical protein
LAKKNQNEHEQMTEFVDKENEGSNCGHDFIGKIGGKELKMGLLRGSPIGEVAADGLAKTEGEG